MGRFDETLGYISTLERATTTQQVCCELLKITGRYGLDRLIAGSMPNQKSTQQELEEHIIFSGWPIEWLQRYVSLNYVDDDPVIAHIKRSLNPFKWEAAAADATGSERERRIAGEAREFKLNNGYAIPMISLDGVVMAVSLGGEKIDMPETDLGTIGLVSTYAIGRAIQIASNRREAIPEERRLTPREVECMRWAAEGKTEWEISVILGISEHTSEKHLLNAKHKLRAANRVEAVARAIRFGYIT